MDFHHIVTMINIVLAVIALIVASVALSEEHKNEAGSIEPAMIDMTALESELFGSHGTGTTAFNLVLDPEDSTSMNSVLKETTGGLSLGNVSVTSTAADINMLHHSAQAGATGSLGLNYHGISIHDKGEIKYAQISGPDAFTHTGTSVHYKLPAAAPTTGQILQSDDTGNMSWATGLTHTNNVLNNVQPATATTTLDGNIYDTTLTTTKLLTLKSTGGNVTISSTADVTLSGSDQVILDGAKVGADSIKINASNAAGGIDIDAGTGGITVDTTGALAIKGGGISTFGDDVAVWSFDGAGAVSETGMTTFSVTPSGAMTLTGGAASTWSTAAGALTLTSAAAATWSTAAGNLTVDSSAGTLILDGHTGVQIDASNSGNIQINVVAGADILIGNDSVAADIKLGNATDTTTEIELNSVLVDINAGTNGIQMDAGGASQLVTSSGALTLTSAAAATWSTAAGALTLEGAAGVTVSSVITNTGAIAGTSGGATNWYSYGAGAVSTESAPKYEQVTIGGTIISSILLDLTGLACKGDSVNDVIGLAAGGDAYIAKYLVGEMGVVYKAEVVIIEAFGQETGTITYDVDIAFNTNDDIAYDGGAGTAELNLGLAGGTAGASNTYHISQPTTTDYIYLVEGDTAATTGVYNAGKLLIKFYGHALF